MRAELVAIKDKSREEIVEEAYRFLELDNLQKVEAKKKGVTMNFLNDGHPGFKLTITSAAGASLGPEGTATKVKLRNFTDEQKVEIKERARQARQEREAGLR